MSIFRSAVAFALWVVVAVYGAQVVRDFYHYVDHAIYLAVDDGETSVAYSLATEGRYAFLSSPILINTVRTHGTVNYGPWYFYLAAGLIWLFGYSLTLVRSIHLWVIVGSVGAAAVWFRGRERAIAVSVFGLAILYCFDVSQWPMARPDSLVSAFALTVVVFSGLALRRWRPAYWFVAGLAAACGALTHLIAWTLLPGAGLLFAMGACWQLSSTSDRRLAWRRVVAGALASAAGAVLGVVSFYASFGFRLREQLGFLAGYRALTASQDPYLAVLRRHFDLAFAYLPAPTASMVWAILAIGWIWVLWSAAVKSERTISARVYLLPPLLLWTLYLVSNGWYTNYHLGYAILHQVLAWWTATAILVLALQAIRTRLPRAGEIAAVIVAILVITQGVRLIASQLDRKSERLRRVSEWVGISEYVDQVLAHVPARAQAWGSVLYGIESPSRIQLVQATDAFTLTSRARPADRAMLAPDFLVFGYPETRDSVLSTLRGGGTVLARALELLPAERFQVVALVSGPPYGTTRIYERTIPQSVASVTTPQVSMYDTVRHTWLSALGRPLPIEFKPVPPATLRIGYEVDPAPGTANHTVAADVPAGAYLIRVGMKPGGGATVRRLIAATAERLLYQKIGERGPDGDFSGYASMDTEVSLLLNHPGGTLSVSQFDDSVGADITQVTATPLIGLLDPAAIPQKATSLPDLASWTPTTGVRTRSEGQGRLAIEGDSSLYGYQISSPLVRAGAGDRITVRIPMRADSGKVCSGILNGTGARWLVAPDAPREELTFAADDSHGFRVVYANCNTSGIAAASRFAIEPGTFTNDVARPYVDQLVEAAAGAPAGSSASDGDAVTGPDVRVFPPGLRVSRKALSGPLAEIQPTDLTFQAGLVRFTPDGWAIDGRAQGPYAYLLRAKDRRLSTSDRVIVSGHLDAGGVTVGLLKNDHWAAQVNVDTAGSFTVVIAPPSSGTYSLLIANDVPDGNRQTSAVVSKFGFLADELKR